MKELFKYLYLWRKKIFFGLLTLLIVDALQLIIPLIIRKVVNLIAEGKITFQSLLFYSGAVLLLALIIAFFRFFWRYFIMGAAREIEKKIREKLFYHLLTLDAYFFDRKKIGDIMAHSTNDLEAIRMATGIGVVAAADFFILFFASLFFMLKISPFLTLLALIPMPFLSITVFFLSKKIHSIFFKVQAGFSSLTDKVQESISGIRVIKSFVQEKGEEKVFLSLNKDYLNLNMKLAYLWGSFLPLITVISGFSTAIVLFFGGERVIKGTFSLGDFVAFTSYLGILVWPMMALGWVTNLFQRGSASMDRILLLLAEKSSIKEKSPCLRVNKFKGNITFENLTFYYPEKEEPALKNISFEISPREKIGIIGKTGSGKTTLARLLLRIYDPPDKKIFIDGKDIKEYSIQDIRREIFLLPQEPFIFSESIKENIAFAKGSSSFEEIIKAAKLAEINEEIEEFPQKYDTIVGERGVTLSGGQKQRVSLARLFLLDPSVFVLDDALSACDSDTEERILINLTKFLKQKTGIIISYRTSVLKNLDRIIVLVDGEIEDIGTHNELIERDGFYAKLYQIQNALLEVKK